MKEQQQFKKKFCDLFYKERLLLRLTRENLAANLLSPEGGIAIQRFPSNQVPAAIRAFLATRIRRQALAQRLACADVNLFVAMDRLNQEPLGYYWSLTSSQKAYFHDAFRIPIGTALVFNAYVVEGQRKKGVYSQLILSAHHFLLEEKGCSSVYTIVEKQNIPSLRANLKNNLQVEAQNCLIKFCGKNFFSIYRNGINKLYWVLIKPEWTIN